MAILIVTTADEDATAVVTRSFDRLRMSGHGIFVGIAPLQRIAMFENLSPFVSVRAPIPACGPRPTEAREADHSHGTSFTRLSMSAWAARPPAMKLCVRSVGGLPARSVMTPPAAGINARPAAKSHG